MRNSVVPKIIHQTWRSPAVPEHCRDSVESWKRLNPTYESVTLLAGAALPHPLTRRFRLRYRLYTDDDLEAYLDARHADLRPAYDALTVVQRADLLRYLILLDYGGMYGFFLAFPWRWGCRHPHAYCIYRYPWQ